MTYENLLNLMNCYFRELNRVPIRRQLSSYEELNDPKERMTPIFEQVYDELSLRWKQFMEVSTEFDKNYDENDWDGLAKTYDTIEHYYKDLIKSKCVEFLSVGHSKNYAKRSSELNRQSEDIYAKIDYSSPDAYIAEAIGRKKKDEEFRLFTNKLEGTLINKNNQIDELNNQIANLKSQINGLVGVKGKVFCCYLDGHSNYCTILTLYRWIKYR